MPYEKVGKNEPVCIADEVPFDIPESWEWVKISDVFQTVMGQSPRGDSVSNLKNGMEFHQGKVFFGEKYISTSNQTTVSPTKIAEPDSILLCVRAPVGKVNITNRTLCIGRGLCALKPLGGINIDFAFHLLEVYENIFVKQATGTTFVAITGEVVKSQIVPLPPLSEQARIVSKIKELLPLLSQYQNAEIANKKLLKDFPALLKKSILQEAVQGKLVPQDPTDEPASVLLERIRAEKQELIAEGKIKKDKHESVIFRRDNSHYEKLDGIEHCIDGEIPFDIPESWVWVRFFSVIDIATNLVRPDTYADYMHIAPDNIEKATGVLLECRTVQQDKVVSPNHMFYKGQIIYSKIRPLLRKAVIAPFDGLCSADMYPLNTSVNKEYLLRYILSDTFNLQVATTMSSRVKMPKINQDELSNILIPIPPIQEQERIISRVKELFDKITLI